MPEAETTRNEQQLPAEQTTPSTPSSQPHGDQQQPKGPQPPESNENGIDEQETEPDTFPREYVEELRQENARYRTEAKAAETLAGRLHTELVRATGKLADPTDLPFDAEHLEDPEKLSAAVNALIEAKPHLKARRIVGDVGQGGRGSAEAGVNLLGMLRSRA